MNDDIAWSQTKGYKYFNSKIESVILNNNMPMSFLINQ